MNNNEIRVVFFDEFNESDSSDKIGIASGLQSLTGVLISPFKTPYPVQRTNSKPIPEYAGQLRGYYSNRWKPSWSGFNHPRGGITHRGLDIYALIGTEVIAVADGYAMVYPNPTPGDDLGIKVGITFTGSDNKKYDVLYGHLSEIVGTSRSVKKGDVIGKSGCTGNAEDGACATQNSCGGFSSHLHIAVRESYSKAPYLDPMKLFDWKLEYSDDQRDELCKNVF